jgi:hypothetical protein
MANVSLDLQEGFNGESVTIFVDEKEFYRNDNVRTQKLLGFADHVELSGIKGHVAVRIAVDQSGPPLEKQFQLDVNKERYVGISLEKGRLNHIISSSPFGYA